MRNSMRQLTPQYSSNRAVRQYTEQHYLPAAERFRERSEDGCRIGARLLASHLILQQNWSQLRFISQTVQARADQLLFEVRVELGRITPEAVHVELYADALRGGQPECHRVQSWRPAPGSNTEYLFQIAIASTRPAADFTARVIPGYGASVPLEESLILWQR